MTLAALFHLQLARVTVAFEQWRYDIRRREIIDEHFEQRRLSYLAAWNAVEQESPYQ